MLNDEYKFSGAKLKKLREKKKMSIGDLVIKMRGMNLLYASRQLVDNWESETSQPTFSYIAGLCKVFKVRVDDFTEKE